MTNPAPLRWEELPQAMATAELDLAKLLFGPRLANAISHLKLIGSVDPDYIDSEDTRLDAFADEDEALHLLFHAGLIDQHGGVTPDDYRIGMLPKGREVYAQIMRADAGAYLLALADRFEGSEGESNELDVLADVALFKPEGGWVSCVANHAVSKIVCTNKEGQKFTYAAPEWTADRAGTAKALRERAAQGGQP